MTELTVALPTPVSGGMTPKHQPASSEPVANGSAPRSLPIRVAGLTKTYASVTALAQVNMDIAPGEFLTLLGPSGSGKTTLLMILAGFIRPTSGEVYFGDRPVVRVPPHRRNVGMVFQNYALFPHMSVFDNVAYPLRLRKWDRAALVERARWALALVKLEGYERRRVHELSGGQSQRVALARAIVFEPGILLMDEPLSALDKKLREHMQLELRRLHETLGMTTVYVTHDQREALTMSDRVAVIHEGCLMQIERPRVLYDRPANGLVAGFVGESSFVKVRREGGRLSVNGAPLRHQMTELPASDDLYLVLRPEKLRLGHGLGDEANRFSGTVRQVVFQGETILFYIDLEDGTEVLVRDLSSNQVGDVIDRGRQVTLSLRPEDALVVAGPLG